MDAARGVRDSAICALSRSPGMSGLEKVYRLFGVTNVRGTILDLYARSFGLAFLRPSPPSHADIKQQASFKRIKRAVRECIVL